MGIASLDCTVYRVGSRGRPCVRPPACLTDLCSMWGCMSWLVSTARLRPHRSRLISPWDAVAICPTCPLNRTGESTHAAEASRPCVLPARLAGCLPGCMWGRVGRWRERAGRVVNSMFFANNCHSDAWRLAESPACPAGMGQ